MSINDLVEKVKKTAGINNITQIEDIFIEHIDKIIMCVNENTIIINDNIKELGKKIDKLRNDKEQKST